MTSERIPCPDCGLGLLRGNLARHAGSKVCQRTQKRMQFTRDLLSPLYQMAEKMEAFSAELKTLAEAMKRG